MVLSFHTAPPKAEIRAARARLARAWAWPVRLALVACIGVAIWQEPRLAPSAHARMQEAVTYVSTFEATNRVRGMLAGLRGGTRTSERSGLADKLVGVLKP